MNRERTCRSRHFRYDKVMETNREKEREEDDAEARAAQSLANWTGIYDGLTEDQVEAIDRDINTRANLTRDLP